MLDLGPSQQLKCGDSGFWWIRQGHSTSLHLAWNFMIWKRPLIGQCKSRTDSSFPWTEAFRVLHQAGNDANWINIMISALDTKNRGLHCFGACFPKRARFVHITVLRAHGWRWLAQTTGQPHGHDFSITRKGIEYPFGWWCLRDWLSNSCCSWLEGRVHDGSYQLTLMAIQRVHMQDKKYEDDDCWYSHTIWFQGRNTAVYVNCRAQCYEVWKTGSGLSSSRHLKDWGRSYHHIWNDIKLI